MGAFPGKEGERRGSLDNPRGVVEYGSMKTIGEALARADKNMARVMKIRSRWAEIAGEVLASHTEPVLIKSSKLHVLCDSPAWAQQVCLLAGNIVERVKGVVGLKLSGVEASFGKPGRPRPQRPPEPRTAPFKVEIDPSDIEKVRDPKLADLLRQLARAGRENDA